MLLHGNIHFSETPQIYICMLNFRAPLPCNSSLKSHRSSHLRCSTIKLFLKISQYSQENTCVFNKVAGLQNVLKTYYETKKKTCEWFFLKPRAREHANYVHFHKSISAASNMGEEGANSMCIFAAGWAWVPKQEEKTICVLVERNCLLFYLIIVSREGNQARFELLSKIF